MHPFGTGGAVEEDLWLRFLVRLIGVGHGRVDSRRVS